MSFVWAFADAAVRRWAVLTTLGAVCLALAQLKGTYIDPKFPSPFYTTALWAGLSSLAILIVCFVLTHFGNWVQRDVTERIRPVKRDELGDLLPLYDRVVGGERPTLNELKEVFNANNQAFRFLEKVVRRGFNTKRQFLGFCTIVPIAKEAEPLLAAEQLNGLRMNKSHVLAPRKTCRTIYIGSVGGVGNHARAAVLNYVLGLIDDCAERGVNRIYTRPVTQDGLRVAKKYGFRPVKDDVGPNELRRLYFLDLTQRPDWPTRNRLRSGAK